MARSWIGPAVLAVGITAACTGCGAPAAVPSHPTGSSGSGSTGAAPTTAPARPTKLAGTVRLTFDDGAVTAACPKGQPAADQCFLLSAQLASPRYGPVSLGPGLDVEAPAGARQCGAPTTLRTRLVTAAGALLVLEQGPGLCLGATGTVDRRLRVSGGTGAYAGASGTGTASLAPQAQGLIEVWRLHLAGP